jgi:heptosyltransferase III
MPPDAIDFAKVRRVLVTKLRHHGDVLLTTPVLTALKEHAPHVEIDALVYRDTAPMLEGHPALAQLHTIDRAWKEQGLGTQVPEERALAKTLEARGYEGLIHLTEHPRGARLAKLPGLRFSVAPDTFKPRGLVKSQPFTHLYRTPRGGNQRHQVEVNLDALRRLGLQPSLTGRKLTLVPGDAAATKVQGVLAQAGLANGFVHLHPTSRWLFKCWPVAQTAELVGKLASRGERIVVTAAPSENEMHWVRQLLAALDAEARNAVTDFSGQLSLKDLAALTAYARLFIGVDSAPMHIAAAMGTPTVALFGPSGEHEWGPWQVRSEIVTSEHTCRPCGHDGCGGGKVSECLTTLPVSRVWESVERVLAAP